jgi:hypothetical protein
LVIALPAELADRLERRCSPIPLEKLALLALIATDRAFDLADRASEVALDVERGRS